MRLRGKNIEKRFEDKQVLAGLCFDVGHGNAVALTGASGRGKTTLLRLVLGLERADAGELLREKRDGGILPAGQPAFAGCVFQEDRLLEDCSAIENVCAALAGGELFTPEGIVPAGNGRSAREQRERTVRNALLELLSEDSISQPVRELSGGMRRRVCLARACLCPAEWLVLDEPFTGLDAGTRRQAISFLTRYQGGRTILMATHSTEGLNFDGVIEVTDRPIKKTP